MRELFQKSFQSIAKVLLPGHPPTGGLCKPPPHVFTNYAFKRQHIRFCNGNILTSKLGPPLFWSRRMHCLLMFYSLIFLKSHGKFEFILALLKCQALNSGNFNFEPPPLQKLLLQLHHWS